MRDIKRTFSILSVLVFGATSLFAATHTTALDEVLAGADERALVRVVLFLHDPVDVHEVYGVASRLVAEERRAHTVNQLKARFEQSGTALLETLAGGKANDAVGRLRPLWVANGVFCEVTPSFLQICEEQHPEIEAVMFDRKFENTLDDKATPWCAPRHLDNISWGVADIGAVRVWDEFAVYGQGVIVGMMDSGIDMDHPDLADKIWVNPGEDLNGNGAVDEEERNDIDDDGNGYVDDFYGWNFDEDDDNVSDGHGHGTSTAGIVAGGWTVCDTVGIAPEAKLMVLRVADASGSVWQSSCWLAMQYAIENGAHAISASLSFKFTECSDPYGCPDPTVWRCINELELAAGLVHVNSAGNEAVGLGAPLSMPVPASSPPPWLSPAQELVGGVSSIIAVSGYLANGSYYASSGRGPSAWSDEDLCFHPAMPHCHGDAWPPEYDDYPYQNGAYMGLLKPEICAPTGVNTLARGGGCRYGFSGTSAAAPHVGGAVALIMSAAPGISPEELCRALKLTARDDGAPGEDSLFGAGKVDAYAAVAFVLDSLGEVTGTVTDDATGLPLEGVRVRTEESRAVFTGETGLYHLFIPPGGDTIRYYRYGYERANQGVQVLGGETVTLNLSLPVAEAGTLQGTVYDELAVPQSGAVVRVLDTPLTPMSTGQNGYFETTIASGRYEVVATAELLEPDTETVLITGSQTTVQDFYLGDSPRILPTGPDAYGYVAWDNVDSAGVAYDWIEINPAHGGPGTALTIFEDQLTELLLPFAFQFYGASYDTVSVTENGFVVLGASDEGSWPHFPIPSTSGPGNLLAPFWTDFRADASGAAYASYFDAPNHRFIIEWDSAGFYNWLDRRMTFEVILYDPEFYGTESGDGVILFQYKRVDFDMYCTVGIENSAEDDGIQYLFNTVLDPHAARVTEGRSIYFTTGHVSVSAPVTSGLPESFHLSPCWPNPFNPVTTLEWGMPRAARVRLEVFDILGRRVAVVAQGNYTAGIHRHTFDGHRLATGVYFARLTCDGTVIQSRKMLFMK